MRERIISLGLAVAALLLLPCGDARGGPEKDGEAGAAPAAAPATAPETAREGAPDFKFSKRDLAESYRPYRVHGVDWYRTIGAARLRENRLRRSQGRARPLFQMRMLGPMDGPT